MLTLERLSPGVDEDDEDDDMLDLPDWHDMTQD